MQPVTEAARSLAAHTIGSSAVDAPATQSAPHLTVIVPESGWAPLDLGELWRYRDLLMLLAWRDIAARYRQSVIGYGWVLKHFTTAWSPFIDSVVLTFSVLAQLLQLPSIADLKPCHRLCLL